MSINYLQRTELQTALEILFSNLTPRFQQESALEQTHDLGLIQNNVYVTDGHPVSTLGK